MTRDELAARLFVVSIQAQTEAFLAHPMTCGDPVELEDDLARLALDYADAFEAERKRRLTEPEGK